MKISIRIKDFDGDTNQELTKMLWELDKIIDKYPHVVDRYEIVV